MPKDEQKSESMLSEWITRAEVAAELRITTETLCRWNSRRLGPPPTRVGRKVYYRRETLHEWLLNQEQDLSSEPKRSAYQMRNHRVVRRG